MDPCNPSPPPLAKCQDMTITGLAFLSDTIKHPNCLKNIAIATTLTACWKVNKIKKNITMSPTAQTPIWQNPDFTATNL